MVVLRWRCGLWKVTVIVGLMGKFRLQVGSCACGLDCYHLSHHDKERVKRLHNILMSGSFLIYHYLSRLVILSMEKTIDHQGD